jgi:hypothetical protein
LMNSIPATGIELIYKVLNYRRHLKNIQIVTDKVTV